VNEQFFGAAALVVGVAPTFAAEATAASARTAIATIAALFLLLITPPSSALGGTTGREASEFPTFQTTSKVAGNPDADPRAFERGGDL
jgi:hypothetical protein